MIKLVNSKRFLKVAIFATIIEIFTHLTLSRRRPLYRNQSIDLLRKSMDWFLYDNGLRLERVKIEAHKIQNKLAPPKLETMLERKSILYNFRDPQPSRHMTSFQRLYEVYTTSVTLYRRLLDVETTSCVYWEGIVEQRKRTVDYGLASLISRLPQLWSLVPDKFL